VRHVKSAYNAIDKNEVPGYREFAEQFDAEYANLDLRAVVNGAFPSEDLRKKAVELAPILEAQESDYDTEIAEGAKEEQAAITGKKLSGLIPLPSTIYVSPYPRAGKTLEGLREGWPKLATIKTFEDDRIREQEFGKQAIYNDWRLYFVFNPEQALLRKRSTEYEYKHEQGESLLDVRNRVRSFFSMLIREHGGERRDPEDVMLITHHLTIMAIRANVERWSREDFLKQNKVNRPPNCSVTTYEGAGTSSDRSPQGQEGRLVLKHENLVLF